MKDFLPQHKIFEKGRASLARAQRVLIIGDPDALIGRKVDVCFGVWTLFCFWDLLVCFAALADHGVEVVVFFSHLHHAPANGRAKPSVTTLKFSSLELAI
jgi:hypothetical protein